MKDPKISQLFTEDTCIKVFNPEKQELIAVFKTYSKAAARLGVVPSTVQHKVNSKRRMFSPTLNMEVAVRLGQIKPGYEDLITKSDHFKPLNK